MTHKVLFVGILSAAVVTGAGFGCKAVNSTERKDKQYEVSEIEAKKVVRDGYARDYAGVVDVRESRVNDGFMKVQVELVNNNLRPGNMNYKFEWFDEAGMIVNTGTGWTGITIQTGEQISLAATAPNERCRDFRLKIERRLGR